jgi:hypothetical protein
MIKNLKISTTIDELCVGIPPEFGTLLQLSRSLNYVDEPNYDECINLFV